MQTISAPSQRSIRLSLSSVVLLLSLATMSPAQDWPRFRGPNGSGVSAIKTLPTEWTESDYRWQIDLPGVGHSSPVVRGNLLVATCGLEADGTRILLGIDATTGRQLWRTEFAAAKPRQHKLNSLASATPAIDDRGIYTCWATPESFRAVALDHQGREKWQVDLGAFKGGHGDGVSPIVHNELVIVPKEHQGDSEILALDRSTGRVVWRVARKSRATWATPCVFDAHGKAELIFVNYEHGITSLDPSDGEVNWEVDVFDKGHTESTIGSPVIAGDLVLGGSGYLSVRQEVIAVRPRADDHQNVERVYCLDRSAPLCTTPLVVGDLLFLWADEGIVTCADAQTGEVHWRKRVGGTFYASPVAAAGHLYNISAAGSVVVLAAEKQYRLVSRIELGEGSHSTAAIANGAIYLRTCTKLFAVGAPGTEQAGP
jgi:outer membrane protein assembly factor BamB